MLDMRVDSSLQKKWENQQINKHASRLSAKKLDTLLLCLNNIFSIV
jgi:hypothetical protein